MSKEKIIVVELTEEQTQYIVNICDIALKVEGISRLVEVAEVIQAVNKAKDKKV